MCEQDSQIKTLNLNTAIQKSRQVLGDDARNPRFVETVPRQGYRFIAPAQFKHRQASELEPLSPVADPVPAPSIRRSRAIDWRYAAALAAVGGFGLALLLGSRPQKRSGALLRLSITPPPGVELRHGIQGGSAISPDGAAVVFAGSRDGKRQLWLRRLNSSEATALPGTDDAILPFWSPDSKSIGFQSGGKIRRVAGAVGRAGTQLAECAGAV